MKATIRLTIDLETCVGRHLLFFKRRMYTKAVFEGDMEVGDIRIGETLLLAIYNDLYPSQMIVRDIRKEPHAGLSYVKNYIDFYERSEGFRFVKDGVIGGDMRSYTLKESFDRLHGPIANRLARYGLLMDPMGSRVGPEPTYVYLPSTIGGTSTCIAECSYRS